MFLTYVLCLNVEAHINYMEPKPQSCTHSNNTYNIPVLPQFKVSAMIFTCPSFTEAGLSLSHRVLVRILSLKSVCGGFALHSPGQQHEQGRRKTARRSGLVYSCVGKKTGRRKWGLTVSWSTIGWWQIQCDWAELGDDPYSMQNSLSCWSVPTSP